MPLSENMNVCFWAEGEISARPSQKEPKSRHFLEQVHSTVDMTYYRYVTPIVLGTYITRSFQKRRKAQTLDPMAQKLVQARGAHFYHIKSSTYIVCLLIGYYCLQEYTFPSIVIKAQVLRSV